MIVLRKFASAVFMAMALALALGGQAAPAQAVGGTVYVGAPGSGCPAGGVHYGDIQAAVDATPQPKKIVVCPGGYDPVTIEGKHNLKLVAKGAVGIVPDVSDFSGPLVYVHNSSNITIQGFFVDGDLDFGAGGGYGIWFDESTGSILKNHVLRIREEMIDTYSMVPFTGIYISGSGGKRVKVISNTVQDYEWTGIDVSGDVRVQVARNRVVGTVWDVFVPCACGFAPTAILVQNNHSASVTENVIQSNFTFLTNSAFPLNFSYGVGLFQSSGISVSGNKITDVGAGVYVFDWGVGGTSIEASRNKIIGNTITDSIMGIIIDSNDTSGLALVDTHTDRNRVTRNTIVSNDLFGMIGILLTMNDEAGDDPIHAFADHNVITGNVLAGFLFGGDISVDPNASNTTVLRNKTDRLPKPGATPNPEVGFSSMARPFLSSMHQD